MRILYINDELATADGSNYHALGLWNALRDALGEENVRAFPPPADGSGVRVDHRTLGLRERLKFPLQLLRIVRKAILSRRRFRQLTSQLAAEGFTPTHILSRTILFDTTALLTAKHFGAKLIIECNAPLYYEHGVAGGLPLPGAMKRWEKKVLTAADKIYTVSDVCRDMLCEQYGLSRDRFFTIPNGYMASLFSQDAGQREQIRSRIRTAEGFGDKFVVIFVGSLKKWHGIDLLCRTAELLDGRADLHFLVVGDGPEHEQIEAYCAAHGNMTFKGKLALPDMAEYLYASDLGVMPYHKSEHFYFSPLKLYDMVGAGLPFLGAAQGQIAQICRERFSEEFLIDDCAPQAVADRISRIAKSPEIYRAMQKAVADSRAGMSWDARAAQLLDFMTD